MSENKSDDKIVEETEAPVTEDTAVTDEPSQEGSATPESSAQVDGAAAAVATPYKGFAAKLDKFFGISSAGSNFKTEIIAGLTTFMAMVYILMVNAGMFSEGFIVNGMSYGGAYIATAIGAIVGTMLMALLARMPLAQASGMGINAFIVYTLLLFTGLTFANSMIFVLIDGLIFLLLTVTGLRKKIFDAIPAGVRHAIPVGIGLFIAFIGFQQAGVIVNNDSTLVTFASFNVLDSNNAFVAFGNNTITGMLPAIIAIFGVLAIAVMSKKKVKGAILWGILGSTALYYVLMGFTCLSKGADLVSFTYAASDIASVDLTAISDFITQSYGINDAGEKFLQVVVTNMPADLFTATFGSIPAAATHFYTNGAAAGSFFGSIASSFSSPIDAFKDWGMHGVGQVFASGFNFDGYLAIEGNNGGSLAVLLITSALSLCMIDMFDTIGTLYGACAKGNLLDENGTPIKMEKMMLCDAIATCTGAIAGTSTVTTFVESSAGVAAGGKTGFASLVTSLCFVVALFLSPIAQLIPRSATATALIWVGVLMMTSVTKVDWTDACEAIVAFFTLLVMLLGYSISKGIGAGIIAYVIVSICTGKIKKISIPTWVIFVLYIATFVLT